MFRLAKNFFWRFFLWESGNYLIFGCKAAFLRTTGGQSPSRKRPNFIYKLKLLGTLEGLKSDNLFIVQQKKWKPREFSVLLWNP